MRVGISTSSLFMRLNNDECFDVFKEIGVDISEVFLTTFSEYDREYGRLIAEKKGDIKIHSVHDLNTHFEPQLYSRHEKVIADACYWLSKVMEAAFEFGAEYYTFHGVARLKKTPINMDFGFIGEKTNDIIDFCKKFGVKLSYENVHWAYYSYPGFFRELKKRCPALKGTLDIKQAHQSEFSYEEYIDDMDGDISTVHVSDIDENGRICLPGKGVFDFEKLFTRLKSAGFEGALLIEVYKESYVDFLQLKQSFEFLKELKDKVY